MKNKSPIDREIARLRALYSLPSPCLFRQDRELILQLNESWGQADAVKLLGHYGCTWSDGPLLVALSEASEMLGKAFPRG
jgi:hypothetical protein